MIVSDVAVDRTDDFTKLSARISPETTRPGKKRREFRIRFRVHGVELDVPLWGDPFLAALLPACMYSREKLHIDAPVSQRLLDTVPKIQETYRDWFAGFDEIPVTCAETHGERRSTVSPGAVTLFSGGLDSWFTLLEHRSDITHLLLIRGFDVKNDDDVLWEKAAACVRRAAESTGTTAVFVETNLKRRADISHRNCTWGRPFPGFFWSTCLGGALSTVAMCLQDIVARTYIPSSYHTSELFRHGTHPDLDPLWSTDNVQVVHDGCEEHRLEKTRAVVAQSAVALETLRVCWQNIPNVLNCCRCEKCVRTMIALRICGVLERAAAFHKPLTLSRVRRTVVAKKLRPPYRYMMDEARRMGDTELAEAIAIVLGDKFSLSHVWGLTHQRIGENILKRTPPHLVPWVRWAFGPVLKSANVPPGVADDKETAP
ncbi:hypothetical protein JW916_01320 [Candidatus Sumerlaeota bacterium]|nr:hypothetical protein [Candidatus Sumerlaeota bacterium]